jgi:hypothetical protein
VHQFEKLPRTVMVDLDIPESYFVFVDMVVAFDHILNKSWIIVNPGAREQEMGFRRPEPDQWGRLYDEAATKLLALGSTLMAKNMSERPRRRKGVTRRFSLNRT